MWERRRELIAKNRLDVPPLDESIDFVRSLGKETVLGKLRRFRAEGRVAIQARSGVGAVAAMAEKLRTLEQSGADIATCTLDSHERLQRFAEADRCRRHHPDRLNGYPLVSHGYETNRWLNAQLRSPVQLRHGSPYPQIVFEMAIASAITGFEGGGLCYNIPYCKSVPIAASLEAWRYVDLGCAYLASRGLEIDRELFGTLTAVLIPPSLSLAITLLEALLAAAAGVTSFSVAYPQSGNIVQDVAALRAIPEVAARYLPHGVEVFPTLHQYMGPFPRERTRAVALILLGAVSGKLGGATRIITKTHEEAFGLPTTEANVFGIRTTRAAVDCLSVELPEAEVAQEKAWILEEVDELVSPILEEAGDDLPKAIVRAFEDGRLDVPFPASRFAHDRVTPLRDARGAIRYHDAAGLPLSGAVRRRHRLQLGRASDSTTLEDRLMSAIHYFSKEGGRT